MRRIPREVEKPWLIRLRGAAVEEAERGLRLHHHAEALVAYQVRRVGERLPLQVMRSDKLPHLPAPVFIKALLFWHMLLAVAE